MRNFSAGVWQTSCVTAGKTLDRRRTKTPVLKLGQPLFIQIPKVVAATMLTSCALLATVVDNLVGHFIWLGGVTLLISAFAAWFVGNRFAVTLGLYLIMVVGLNAQPLGLNMLSMRDLTNISFQLGSALIVVLMLGVAREALEAEWKYARIDPLTNALNRKAFFESIDKYAGSGDPCVLIFADLDGLKNLNDQFGHERGDEALKSFAKAVRMAIRKDDLFARIGGDEFVFLINLQELWVARLIAARLNSVVNLAPEIGSGLKCSFGVLVMPNGTKSIDEELRQADSLMYEAKKGRRGFAIASRIKADARYSVSLAPSPSTGGERDNFQDHELAA